MSPHPTRRRRTKLPVVLGLAAVLGVGGVALATGGTSTGGLTAATGSADTASVRAAFSTVSSWDSGYTGQYTLTNTGTDTVHGWDLSFDLPAGAKVTSLWNGVSHQNGAQVTVKNESWNGDIAPGQARQVGFTVDGKATTPASCQVNGASCSGGGTPTSSPTTKPPTTTPTPEPPTGTPPSSSAGGFAPYVDVGLYPPYDLTGTAAKTGVKTFNLAFIVSGGGCTPKWGGSQALADNEVAKQIGALRAAGGDVRVSFGGANGTELAQACSGSGQLATAYKQVIDAFKLKKVDFDVEGAAIADQAANTRRAQAIATLQKQVAGLDVSFTLPVLPSGLTQDGVNLLKTAKQNGDSVSAVNIMAMDYGDGQAPNPSGKMGDYAIQAATSTESQVRGALGVSSAWSKIAVTPMIGVNDTNTEVFTVADAKKLAAFAKQKNLAWLSMWSATRDKPCPGGPQQWASATCSSIAQTALDFTKAFSG
ncbi:cellulose binding domain-containing protein [Actinoallomurus purpureus]|uniref:glycoside hydrolase family 18 protein n=1 Tax=Actinoallomurus purpureus TaxID=478114 RepID=UPI0020931121|nr:cellulose binding domain-containing protein [Actinoallomurus purpureus]MCO6008358.1 cellulose binding domain-containing protein [Actinoallomurus purpureus]